MKMVQNERVEEILIILEEIKADDDTPRRIREKVQNVIHELNTNEETTVAAHNAIYELDGLGENASMESFTRTQILQVVSMLESL